MIDWQPDRWIKVKRQTDSEMQIQSDREAKLDRLTWMVRYGNFE